ncbi:hypothetical protein PTSG_07539 [Salpingoeca rosetta]|uniref:Uncharacterized protein n=1 Tax=Salpingoeca rosetta (strain ATCC 50818 / BSB-021) TaxID=946362 RepID=F2UH21_SALR5|nr:uncharacterized protein PTSG_07539 [Salpingoeca rosetta]EGD76420.1 hypothetical protein PTSG_07539 [Salpingoeca rosetta]|eukprot:XP_004991335.1 hypothetical protein PTSG_07539 [Salpingoeca rosetta]
MGDRRGNNGDEGEQGRFSRRPVRGDDGFGSGEQRVEYPFIKGFAAGLFVAHFNRHLLMGALLGTAAGMYYQQEFGAPDVKQVYDDTCEKLKDLLKPPKK